MQLDKKINSNLPINNLNSILNLLFEIIYFNLNFTKIINFLSIIQMFLFLFIF